MNIQVDGQRFKDIRTKVGLTQADIALKIGTSRSYVNSLENTSPLCNPSIRRKLSESVTLGFAEFYLWKCCPNFGAASSGPSVNMKEINIDVDYTILKKIKNTSIKKINILQVPIDPNYDNVFRDEIKFLESIQKKDNNSINTNISQDANELMRYRNFLINMKLAGIGVYIVPSYDIIIDVLDEEEINKRNKPKNVLDQGNNTNNFLNLIKKSKITWILQFGIIVGDQNKPPDYIRCSFDIFLRNKNIAKPFHVDCNEFMDSNTKSWVPEIENIILDARPDIPLANDITSDEVYEKFTEYKEDKM